MATEDPWDAPDPTKLRISAVPATRPVERRPGRDKPATATPPPHHASPRPEHGVIDEAAVEAPPIPRPEQPRAPKPAMIDTRVSQGTTPTPPAAMADGFDGASWRDVDDAPAPARSPPVRPWARNAGMTIGAVATLTILGLVLYVVAMGAIRAIQETDPDRRAAAPPPPPAPLVEQPPPAFPDPLETSIIDDDEVPPQPIELPPEVDAYGDEPVEYEEIEEIP